MLMGNFRLNKQIIIFSIDVDECSLDLAECSSDAKCINIEGSYECYCSSGYEGDGFICKGINIHHYAYIIYYHDWLISLPFVVNRCQWVFDSRHSRVWAKCYMQEYTWQLSVCVWWWLSGRWSHMHHMNSPHPINLPLRLYCACLQRFICRYEYVAMYVSLLLRFKS